MDRAFARLRILESAEALATAGADWFLAHAREALAHRGRFTAALAGGGTPRATYRSLARRAEEPDDHAALAAAHLFWSDERYVPPVHPESNYRMALEVLIGPAALPPENIHRVPTEEPDPVIAAARYDAEIARFFAVPSGGWPRFDAILLGMGQDGHTASLFPGSILLEERERRVASAEAPAGPSAPGTVAARITFTPLLLNAARAVAILVSGQEKAEILRAVLESPHDPNRFPIQIVEPEEGELVWLVDTAAASRLSRETRERFMVS